MLESLLFTDCGHLHVDNITPMPDCLRVEVTATNPFSICPVCKQPSKRVHSWYQRCPGDLPIAGTIFRLLVNVRRWWCGTAGCRRVIFTERIPEFIDSYARRTARLASAQTRIAFSTGGEPGSRLSGALGMPASGDTLLRLIRREPDPVADTPRVLGVDEWAKRKGHSYGTILVDLEKNCVVDLLPDRSADTLAAWLRAHPGVEVISRDRGGEYIRGATDGAADAEQVADRFHLVENLRDVIQKEFILHREWLNVPGTPDPGNTGADAANPPAADNPPPREDLPATPEPVAPGSPAEPGPAATAGQSRADRLAEARRAVRNERFAKVNALHQAGQSIRQIARQLDMSRVTIRRYLKAESCLKCPERQARATKIAPYVQYLHERWREGCHSASHLWREIREQGFRGSHGTVSRWVRGLSRGQPAAKGAGGGRSPVVLWTPRAASWLLMKPPDTLREPDASALASMLSAHDEMARLYALGQRFVTMMRTRQPADLSAWLEEALSRAVDGIAGFAEGLRQDWQAVVRAFISPWSNGQVEGQVNRLKTIKRQMYGRAGFDLLRKRVLIGN